MWGGSHRREWVLLESTDEGTIIHTMGSIGGKMAAPCGATTKFRTEYPPKNGKRCSKCFDEKGRRRRSEHDCKGKGSGKRIGYLYDNMVYEGPVTEVTVFQTGKKRIE